MPFVLEYHDVIGSTNDRAKELAASGILNICVAANEQTAGRGRKGRSFFSPSGSGLDLSAVLPPEDATLLTVRAAVCVAETIEEAIGERTEIKWVNDILLHGKKIGGILAEGAFGPDGKPAYAVVGIGINVFRTAFPPELRDVAGDLESLTGLRPDKKALLDRLLAGLDDRTRTPEAVLACYRERSMVIGKTVTVLRGTECFRAQALSVDESGGLWVDRSGERILLSSGEVSVRPESRTAEQERGGKDL